MSARRVVRIVGAVAALIGPLAGAPTIAPTAAADPCSDVEVVFAARGTHQDPGLGNIGRAFTDSLTSKVGGKSVGVYAVNYPANDDYRNSAPIGADDASGHIRGIVADCPNTKVVLGGYSQGSTVIDLATQAMSAPVALFGEPTNQFSSMLWGGQLLPTINPRSRAARPSACAPDDPICSGGGNIMAHVSYIQSGMTDQAASYAADRLR
ncbi:cutinase family protein [Mycobacterium tilburgii]|uniref:cutinase family protein n=1 Tax=Mycobacterium tilburgii TaxID=44467 RepID=UPI0011827E54|nr:cutinase family protein [Mycobacterium tilburgii]